MKSLSLKSLFVLLPILYLTEIAFAYSDVRVLSVGSNKSFKSELKPLKYAENDAKRFIKTMETVGLVPALRAIHLKGPTVDEFRLATRHLIKQINSFNQHKKNQGKFIFYFSGHSDEQGLHFKDGLLTKEELHQTIGSIRAHIKIAILDSCFSGALSVKGIENTEEFELPKMIFDEPSGSVFLSASSARQFSFESDNLESSIFTHHLIKGLYGDADGNTDGIVTVDELYQYVYRNTKWYTLNLPTSSLQHPEYFAKLEGRGTIALSFPSQTTSTLNVDPSLRGEISIASEKGLQFFKVFKEEGRPKNIRLPVGVYKFSIRDNDKIGLGKINLSSTKKNYLAATNLEWMGTDSINTAGSKGSVDTEMTTKEKSGLDSELIMMVGAHSGFMEGDYGPLLGIGYFNNYLSSKRFSAGLGGILDIYTNHAREKGTIVTNSISGHIVLHFKTIARKFQFGLFGGGGQIYLHQKINGDYKENSLDGTAPGYVFGVALGRKILKSHFLGLNYQYEIFKPKTINRGKITASGHSIALFTYF